MHVAGGYFKFLIAIFRMMPVRIRSSNTLANKGFTRLPCPTA
jgi:hypothetical protein